MQKFVDVHPCFPCVHLILILYIKCMWYSKNHQNTNQRVSAGGVPLPHTLAPSVHHYIQILEFLGFIRCAFLFFYKNNIMLRSEGKIVFSTSAKLAHSVDLLKNKPAKFVSHFFDIPTIYYDFWKI